MADYIDLHIHTNHSDGTSSVGEILDMLRKQDLAAFALADHDTISGYHEMQPLITLGDPELVPGVEISAAVEGDEMHILAYLFDPDNDKLNSALNQFQHGRNQRGRLIVQRLKDLGISIPFEEVERTANHSVIGRPHIAETMHRLGATRSYQEGFDRHIGKGRPAYIPKPTLDPPEVIELIHGAGGVAVMAHPLVDGMIRHLDMMVGLGLDGIEVWHYSVMHKDVARLKKLAAKHNLLVTGGSDFHGRGEPHQVPGRQQIPIDCLDSLKVRATEIRGRV